MLIFSYIIFVCAIVFGAIFLFSAPMRAWLNENSNAITVVFAIIAGTYVLIEYQHNQKEQRLDRTRSYIERIESGTVHESRQWFDLHWILNRKLIKDIDDANFGENADRDTAKRLMAEYMADFDELNENLDELNIQHLMRLFYFYSDLAKCVELGLCDQETACHVFAEDIGAFYVLHSDFIVKWREVSFEKNFETIKDFLNDRCSVG